MIITEKCRHDVIHPGIHRVEGMILLAEIASKFFRCRADEAELC